MSLKSPVSVRGKTIRPIVSHIFFWTHIFFMFVLLRLAFIGIIDIFGTSEFILCIVFLQTPSPSPPSTCSPSYRHCTSYTRDVDMEILANNWRRVTRFFFLVFSKENSAFGCVVCTIGRGRYVQTHIICRFEWQYIYSRNASRLQITQTFCISTKSKYEIKPSVFVVVVFVSVHLINYLSR